MNIVILDDYQDSVRKLVCADKLFAFNAKVYTNSIKGIERLTLRLREAQIVVLFYARTEINAALLNKLPNLKLIVQIGNSVEHLDLAACTARGVAVATGFDLPLVQAETTFALMLTAAKRLSQYIARLKMGVWQQSCLKSTIRPDNFSLPTRLQRKTLVLLGYNEVSMLLAKYADAFDMKVVFWGEAQQLARASAAGWQTSSNLAEVFSQADFLSIHLDFAANTKQLISYGLISRMKKSAVLINTSHPGLVATNALLSSLSQGRPGFAVIDVFDTEPPLSGSSLINMENCICSPHINNVELELFEQQFAMAFDDIVNFCNGTATNIINPSVLAGSN